MRRGLLSSTWRSFLHLFGLRTHYSLAVPLLCCKCEGQVGWNQNFEFLLTGVSGEPEAACLNEQVRRKERGQREPRVWGRERSEWRRKTYIHGNVPGHVDVGFVFIHPHLSGTQGIAFSVVIYVIVVGLLGALDVSHSGTWEDFHTPTALPHLDSSRESPGFRERFQNHTGTSSSSSFSISCTDRKEEVAALQSRLVTKCDEVVHTVVQLDPTFLNESFNHNLFFFFFYHIFTKASKHWRSVCTPELVHDSSLKPACGLCSIWCLSSTFWNPFTAHFPSPLCI